jgi:bifunctional non-homologous end joining protein LigD
MFADSFVEPMMALRVRELPVGNWLYEMKFDGYRALAFKTGKEVRLLSRNQTLFNDNYPQLVDSLKTLKAKSFIIDGEIAALDEHGRSSFQRLQSYALRKGIPLVYYAFDLLRLNGTDLRSRPLVERRELLDKLVKKAPENIKFSEELQGTREELVQVARQFQLEGLSAKRRDSLYESGRRSGAWVKVKLTQQQEFVIGGYTHLSAAASTSVLCCVATTARRDFSSPAELGRASPKKPWQPCTKACRKSGGRPAHSSTCRRKDQVDGARVSHLRS